MSDFTFQTSSEILEEEERKILIEQIIKKMQRHMDISVEEVTKKLDARTTLALKTMNK